LKTLFAIALALLVGCCDQQQPAAPAAPGVSVNIVSVDRGDASGIMHLLAVIENKSAQNYKLVSFSCSLYQDGQFVHEHGGVVFNIAPNSEVTWRSSTTNHQFNSSRCRLTGSTQ